MGVDLAVYRSRIGQFVPRPVRDILSNVDYLCKAIASVRGGLIRQDGLNSKGAVTFIGLLLRAQGIEPNPGPRPGKESEHSFADTSAEDNEDINITIDSNADPNIAERISSQAMGSLLPAINPTDTGSSQSNEYPDAVATPGPSSGAIAKTIILRPENMVFNYLDNRKYNEEIHVKNTNLENAEYVCTGDQTIIHTAPTDSDDDSVPKRKKKREEEKGVPKCHKRNPCEETGVEDESISKPKKMKQQKEAKSKSPKQIMLEGQAGDDNDQDILKQRKKSEKRILLEGLKLRCHVQEAVARAGDGRKNSYLDSLTERLTRCKSDNTNKKYYSGFCRWRVFITSQGHESLPAQSIHVALYLVHLLDNGASAGVVESAMYAIKWAHDLTGVEDPTKNVFVKNIVESARRTSKAPVHKKDPVTTDMLIKLCDNFVGCSDLLVVRDLCMILVSFAGFLRFSEICNLHCTDVLVEADHLVINIRKSKTDQYRLEDQVVISQGHTSACPYKMVTRYIDVAQIDLSSDDYFFKQIVRSGKTWKLIYEHKPLSYTGMREAVVKRLRTVSGELNIGLHSLRSGGASAAANNDVSERCLKRHGRWKLDSSKDGYIADSLAKSKEISQKLGL